MVYMREASMSYIVTCFPKQETNVLLQRRIGTAWLSQALSLLALLALARFALRSLQMNDERTFH